MAAPRKMTGAFHWVDRWRLSPAFSDGTAEEQGLFRNLSDELWVRVDAVIPDDDRVLAKASGDHEAWARCRDRVLGWMTRVDGGWTIDDVLDTRREASRRAKKQADWRVRKAAEKATSGNEGGNATGNEAGNTAGSPFTVHRSLTANSNNPPIPPGGGDFDLAEGLTSAEATNGNGHQALTAALRASLDQRGAADSVRAERDNAEAAWQQVKRAVGHPIRDDVRRRGLKALRAGHSVADVIEAVNDPLSELYPRIKGP